MNAELILNELREISSSIKGLSEVKDISIYKDNLLLLSGYKARVNDLMPEIEFMFDEQLAIVSEEILEKYKDNVKGNSSYIKAIIKGEMKTEQRLLNYAERINNTIDLLSKNLVTVISYLKAELNNH